MTLPLSEIGLNSPVAVRQVGGARPFRRRLMELGLVPGTEVVITKVAPLGDPLEIAVRGSRLSIRQQEAAALMVDAPADHAQIA